MKTTQSKRDLKYKVRLLFPALPKTRTTFLKKKRKKIGHGMLRTNSFWERTTQNFIFEGYVIVQSPLQSTVQAK